MDKQAVVGNPNPITASGQMCGSRGAELLGKSTGEEGPQAGFLEVSDDVGNGFIRSFGAGKASLEVIRGEELHIALEAFSGLGAKGATFEGLGRKTDHTQEA
jgi:hypothetical protein